MALTRRGDLGPSGQVRLLTTTLSHSLIGEWRGLFPLRSSRCDFQCGFQLALPSLPRQQLAYESFFPK